MVALESLPFHDAAAIFPLLEDDELQAMVENIREHGLRESIKTYDGKIIDGRNRMTACRLAGVAPRFEPAPVNGSAADYVYSVNYHRRHLTDGGRQLASGRYKEVAAKEAAERKKATEGRPKKGSEKPAASAPQVSGKPKREPDARTVAGQKFGVGGKTVDAAAKVLAKAAPEVVKAVERGTMPVATAARLAEAPKKVQVAAVAEGKAAVRKAIETHAPTIKEEARNCAGVRWHKVDARFDDARQRHS
jgi:hypothetical protein